MKKENINSILLFLLTLLVVAHIWFDGRNVKAANKNFDDLLKISENHQKVIILMSDRIIDLADANNKQYELDSMIVKTLIKNKLK